MTAQTGDFVRYAGEDHDLVGVSPDNPNDELFDPEKYGIRTFSNTTACWRGYVATYGLREGRLVLEELAINVRDPEWEKEIRRLTLLKEIRRHLPPHRRGPKPQPRPMKAGPCGPAINGVLPAPPADPQACFTFSDNYHNVGLPLAFTGGLLLGRGFIRRHYEHMGFQAPWKFEKVTELIFTGGVLTSAHDRSSEMATIRDAEGAADGTTGKHFTSPAEIARWIGTCFARRY